MRGALLSLAVAAAVIAGCAPTGPAARAEGEGDGACTSDLECPPGDECIRPRGEIHGLCGRLVNARGAPTTNIRRRADPCQDDFDCPVMFRCELTTPAVGICVKQ